MRNFSTILSALQAAIAVVSARERHLTVLLAAVWGRIGRIRTRLERLIALWRAGMLKKPRASGAGGPRTVVRVPSIIPSASAWLLVAVRDAALARAGLETLLSEAECVEFLAACPQARRILRPLCRMLGVGVAARKVRKPRAIWEMPAAPVAAVKAGLVVGPGGRLMYV